MAYKVPFVNYPLQYHNIKDEIDGAFHKVLERGDLIYREDLQKFERDIANYSGRKWGVSTGSCTGALFISLYGAGIRPGDEVITVSHTYVATIDTIKACGATPVLVDVRDDFNMNPDLLEKAITERTKAIVPVHLNGRMCEMDRIMEIAESHDLIVVEDAAQALGAKFKGSPAGSFGLSGCFSFYPAKMLGSYGEGGMAITDDDEFARKLYLLRDHGELPGYLKSADEKKKKEICLYGFNTIMDNMQAAFLNVKFKHFDGWVKRRREIASLYQEGLSSVEGITLPPEPSNGDYFDIYQNYVIRTKERDALRQHLESSGVETLVSWETPNHKQKALGLDHFKLPVTEAISREVLSLPMYPELSDEEVRYVVNAVSSFFKNR